MNTQERCEMEGEENVNRYQQRPLSAPPVIVSVISPPTLEANNLDFRQETNNSHKKSKSISSVGSGLCRICQSTTREKLISPCNCKGSLGYVHLSCLERWLNQSSRTYCELCLFQFPSEQTQRYGLCESLRLWVRHPRIRNSLQSDILISLLLTIVTAGLVTICLLGMHYFVLEGKKLGIPKIWTHSVISFFLTIVVLGYLITLYLLIKDQFLPWYQWWRRTVNVRLILTPRSSISHVSQRNNMEYVDSYLENVL